jgi:CheY-like chemotaxis protein
MPVMYQPNAFWFVQRAPRGLRGDMGLSCGHLAVLPQGTVCCWCTVSPPVSAKGQLVPHGISPMRHVFGLVVCETDAYYPGMSRYVLVVDDDLAIRQAITMILESEDYQVATAADGAEALERIAELNPAVVLLDLQMPVLTGWDVMRRLREQGVTVPVVVMTAGYRAQAEAEANKAAGFLAKPFELDDVLDVVGRITGRMAGGGGGGYH